MQRAPQRSPGPLHLPAVVDDLRAAAGHVVDGAGAIACGAHHYLPVVRR